MTSSSRTHQILAVSGAHQQTHLRIVHSGLRGSIGRWLRLRGPHERQHLHAARDQDENRTKQGVANRTYTCLPHPETVFKICPLTPFNYMRTQSGGDIPGARRGWRPPGRSQS